jgi:hypothetical protein
MPPRKRSTRSTQKEEEVTTTEAPTETTTPEAPATTTETKKRIRPEDAVFLVDIEEETDVPQVQTRSRDYTPTPYDDALAIKWEDYLNAGSPPWSLSGTWTEKDKPADGWYSDRKGIWFKAVVPNLTDARALLKRASTRLGCSSRIKFNDISDDDGPKYRIWFTAAPVIKNKDGSENVDADAPEEESTTE